MRNTINGSPAGPGEGLDVIDPATLEYIDRVDRCGRAEVDAACQAAAAAGPKWARSETDRQRAMLACAEILAVYEDELARLLTREQGKPLAQAYQELRGNARLLHWYATLDHPDTVLRDTAEELVVATNRPVGVVAIITPWNFPITILAMKLWAALLAGNTVVVKPAPTTPLATLRLAELLSQVLPAGVVNTVTGGAETGSLLTRHPLVGKISFTGSTASGRSVMEAAAPTLKRLTLELGGNDPAVLLDDADLDAVLPAVLRGAFYNAGQVCQAIKRVYVPTAMRDEAVARLVALADTGFVVGHGLQPAVTMGPVNNAAQKQRVTGLVADAGARGALIQPVGEMRHDLPGHFVQPVIVSRIGAAAPLVTEEQFGPALPVVAYDDIDEVVDGLNAGPYGLDASVWSADADRAVTIAARLKVGQAYVNTHAGPPEPDVPFGGVKASGFGRELGIRGLEEVSELRVLRVARAVTA